jgi:hypothetical protein
MTPCHKPTWPARKVSFEAFRSPGSFYFHSKPYLSMAKSEKPKKSETKRFLSVRLTPAEFGQVQRHFHSSACQSLTEYVKKVLTNKPVVIKVRDQSKDDQLECLINMKNKLNLIEDQLALHPQSQPPDNLYQAIKEIHLDLIKIYQQCYPS